MGTAIHSHTVQIIDLLGLQNICKFVTSVLFYLSII